MGLTISSPVGDLENVISARTGEPRIRGTVSGDWGMDSNGASYYAPGGVPSSELARVALARDGSLMVSPITPTGSFSVTERRLEGGRRFGLEPSPSSRPEPQRDENGRLFAQPTGRLIG